MPRPRSSIALFLATTGLIAGMAGCGKAPESSEPKTPAAGQPTPAGGGAVKDPKDSDHNDSKTGTSGEGGEGGEG